MNPVSRHAMALLVALSVGAFCAGSAAAGDSGVRLTTADLDLATAKGVSTLYKRIGAAARAYCQDVTEQTGSRIAHGLDECVADAIGNTVRSINLPALSALHAEATSTKRRG